MCYVSSIYSNSFWYMTSARLLIWGQSLTSQPQVGSETIVGGTGEVRNTGWRYGAARVLFLTATSSRPIRANTTVAEPVDIIEASGWIRNDCLSNSTGTVVSTVVDDQINGRMDLPPLWNRSTDRIKQGTGMLLVIFWGRKYFIWQQLYGLGCFFQNWWHW